MTWQLLRARNAFQNYSALWDEINQSQGNHILLDSKFVGALIRHFSSAETWLAICEDTGGRGLALLERGKSGFWNTFQPSQAPLGLILLENKETLIGQLHDLIRALPGYALGIGIHQQDPDFSVFHDCGDLGSAEKIDYVRTARIDLGGTFEEYWRSRSEDLAKDVERHRRRLAQEGKSCELLIHRQEARMAGCVRDFARWESVGWKTEAGTALTVDGPQGLFYREVLETFSREGEAVAYQLVVDGTPIAGQLSIQRNGMLVSLKIAYDQAYRKLSPGFLLRREILQSLFGSQGMKSMEMYGPIREGWTLKWADELRSMYHVNVYRNRMISGGRRLLRASSSLLRSGGAPPSDGANARATRDATIAS